MPSWPTLPTQWPQQWPQFRSWPRSWSLSNLQPHLTFATLTLTTTLTILLPLAYRNYKTYLSYGPGGAPYNLIGWFGVTFLLLPFGSRNMTSTAVYEKKIEAGETESYLSETTVRLLGEKKRGRPTVGPHYVPQRQIDTFAGEEVKKRLDAEFYALVERNSQLVKLADSRLERHANAIFLADGVVGNDAAGRMKGECAHIHRLKDYSLHVVLAPADCKRVFDAGWAQRHGFSGIKIPTTLTGGQELDLPAEYVFLYAPRTEEEVALVMGVVTAGLRYLTGQEVR
ncbi:hypothetical protein BO70DRAFT_108267 [Aspergillus heteromorphus CBS 117.55]|uniref:Luciferase domain-containing protein n=1 Tax=Aspergillus heteromorphus CBS 117.55 TaxID=1448321 RepID=A0A317VNS5_9EURO|nr:uncharacterized protein BO70DRAFT_108267 [Aspergillus heteromorphus CBS 117.55]PWY73580.1 hypothetical protein BO70DRAFT_108267 [Aspergillus heteromorphus CBS 117.55]